MTHSVTNSLRLRDLKSRNPKDEDSFIGPLISESEAARLHGWIEDAIQRGATLWCGGKREGTMLDRLSSKTFRRMPMLSVYEAYVPVAVLSVL